MTLQPVSFAFYSKFDSSHVFSHENSIYFLGLDASDDMNLSPQERKIISQLNPFSTLKSNSAHPNPSAPASQRTQSTQAQNVNGIQNSQRSNRDTYYPREMPIMSTVNQRPSMPHSNLVSYSALHDGKHAQLKPRVKITKDFENEISCMYCDSSNNILYIGFVTGNVLVFQMEDDIILQSQSNRHCRAVSCMTLSHNGNHLITGGDDGRIVISPIQDLNYVQCELKHCSSIHDIRLTEADGTFVCSSSCSLLFWDWKAVNENPNATPPPKPMKKLINPLLNEAVINSFDIHPFNPSIIVCGYDNGTVSIWDINFSTSVPVKSFEYASCPIWKVRFCVEHNEETQYCYTCDDDGTVLKWEIRRNPNTGALVFQGQSPVQIEFKHPVSSIVDFSFWGFGKDWANCDSIVMLTEFGQPIIKKIKN